MIAPDLHFEQLAWQEGFQIVAGLDEVGRGAWAGPVVAAAVQFSPHMVCYDQALARQELPCLPKLLRDSKKLSPRQRDKLNDQIYTIAAQVAIGVVEVHEINQLGINPANFLAMSRAIDQLKPQPDFILIDGFPHPKIDQHRQRPVVKGDSLVASIAAASIIAKVYRDRLMIELSADYPHYGFNQHKGYGTMAHQQAIRQHGLCALHRRNYKLKFLDS